MKTKMMKLMVAFFAMLVIGIASADAKVTGKYNVTGREGPYTFRGTLTLTSLKTCVIRLRYSDGDSITVNGRFKTALKNIRKKQTTRFTWSVYGMSGGGSLTVQGITGGYLANFNYSGYGISGSGRGTKKP